MYGHGTHTSEEVWEGVDGSTAGENLLGLECIKWRWCVCVSMVTVVLLQGTMGWAEGGCRRCGGVHRCRRGTYRTVFVVSTLCCLATLHFSMCNTVYTAGY